MECETCKYRDEETRECRCLPPDSLITSFVEKVSFVPNQPKQYKVTYGTFYKKVRAETPTCSFYEKT